MAHVNIEIKARCPDPDRIQQILRQCGADYKGLDHQVDTYFKVASGRLKLRQGNIENALIFYERPNAAGPKRADVSLYRMEPAAAAQLYATLTRALDVLVTVDKNREIYFLENVKFHIDAVDGLGNFIEIEAIDETGRIGEKKLRQQCDNYVESFGIAPADLIERSYSDLLLEGKQQ